MWNFQKSGNKKVDGQLVKRCYHEKTRETPMIIYIGLKIYSTSRSRNLIDMLFNLGLCISYDRVLEITKNIYENLREAYENNKFVFPNILKLGLFTVMLKDIRTHSEDGTPFELVDISQPVRSSVKFSPLPSELIHNCERSISE